MTKSRKVGIVVALTLFFALLAVSIFPLVGLSKSITAEAVTVTPRDEWENSYSGSYYDNLNTDLVGTQFRSELVSLITKTHTHQTSYNELKTIFSTTDADPNKSGNVIWFYTGDSVPYTGAMDTGNYPTNREHVWPKMGGDAFPETTQAGSDAHHLRPLNTKLNNTRSNYHFGEVSQAVGNRVAQSGTYSDYGTSDPDTWCYLSGGYFYPAKGYRGATARILFYVQTRWGDTSGLSFTLGSGSAKVMSNVDTLLKWHLQEPPTDEEIRRNEAVYKIQGNRNPFIDHPEYAEMIYCNDGKSYNSTLKNVVAQNSSYLNSNVDPDLIPTSISLSQTSLAMTVGDKSAKITVTPTPATASADVTWTSNNTSVATVVDGVVTAVKVGTATITATSKYDKNVTKSLSVTVSPKPLQSLSLSPSSLNLRTGAGQTLTVTASPSGAATDLTWSSSNDSVATVNQSGYVTAVAPGTATITVKDKTTNISATATVTVTEAPKPIGITVSGVPHKTAYTVGETFDPTGLTVTVNYSDSSFENYTTFDNNFQWLDAETGLSTLSEGTTEIICKYGEFEARITGISVSESFLADFLDKMQVIESVDFANLTLEEKFEAIKQAVAYYGGLTSAEKAQTNVINKYATLRAAIADYNALAEGENEEFQKAMTVGASAVIVAVSATLGAVLVAIVKRTLGR